MGLFRTDDYAFCNLKNCSKKDKCKRNLQHYVGTEIEKSQRLSILLIEDSKKCNLFLDIKNGE